MSVHNLQQLRSVPSLDDRYTLKTGRILVSGTQALVRLLIEQHNLDAENGLKTAGYISGYRGSPLASFDREIERASRFLSPESIVFQPGLNEDLAATAVWGTQQTGLFPGARYDGVFAMWYGKGPGVDRSMDAIRHANAAGTNPHGGVLLLVGDDHGALSSTIPHQSEHNLISAMIPLLSPAGVEEYIRFGLLGFAMSRFSGAWVGFKCQTEIVETTTTVDIPAEFPEIITPDIQLPADGLSIRWPDNQHDQEKRQEDKIRAIQVFARANNLDEILWNNSSARFGIISTGKSWRDLMGALELLGIDEEKAAKLGLRLYKIGMVWPLEPEGVTQFVDGLEQVLVVEEKRPVIEDQLRTQLYNREAKHRPQLYGKTNSFGAPLLPSVGEINPLIVADAISQLLGLQSSMLNKNTDTSMATVDFALREPYFCSGCPHSISTVLPAGSRASGGIGCSLLALATDRNVTTFTQMGGEGISWLGHAPFTDEKHIFVHMGDGTYFHSGILAIRAAIAAKVNATYKILFNDAVAMTGGQKHDGELSIPAVVAQVSAEDVKKVVIVSEMPEQWQGILPTNIEIYHRDALNEVQQILRDTAGISVLIYDQLCAAEKRRRRKRGLHPVPIERVFINDAVCEGCGDCSVISNCISVEPLETTTGIKRQINQSSCNVDASCLKGFCPSFVTVTGAQLKKTRNDDAYNIDQSLPLPQLPDISTRSHNLLLAGIGGTGVVTISAIISQAAHLDGLHILTFDQTGLAQKNGAVTSHLRLSKFKEKLHAPRIGKFESDLILGFDNVTAASPQVIGTVDFDKTAIIVDTAFKPTASFVKRPLAALQIERPLVRLKETISDANLGSIDATYYALQLFGDSVAANMILTGYAWQRGTIPIKIEAIETAIQLNGTAVKQNMAAFNIGRHLAHVPEKVNDLIRQPKQKSELDTLEKVINHHTDFLTKYQNRKYAERYLALVDEVDKAVAPLGIAGQVLLNAVAESAFKLMAYKDEYEVARLHCKTGLKDKLRGSFEGNLILRYHLAPPLLTRIDKRTGKPKKISLGAWIEPVFHILAWAKFMRNTPFDIFGYTNERKQERHCLEEYFDEIKGLCRNLSAMNIGLATEIARLPINIRGYGHVKEKNLKQYYEELSALKSKTSKLSE